ncbi:DNA adenine methylase [Dentiradicibacter hellwigii]|uniref:DNA adenine methylase n=1 Tax=Dentiradicibacter hellwigii TaxID=3149053 RepID=A0ABV4UBX4_9RHOO
MRQKLSAPRRNGITHPILNYLGGKWRIAPWVVEHLPAHHCYVELFGGAASVLLSKPPAPVEVVNDISDEIDILYRVLRNPVRMRRLLRLLQRTPYGVSAYRAAFATSGRDMVETARRLIVRSSMGFHPRAIGRSTATFRTGRTRSPAATWRNYRRGLPAVTRRLRHVIIEHRPALGLVSLYDSPQTLFYADPPYLPETRTSEARYPHEMTVADHEALLKRLCAIGGMALVSGYPSELYNDLLAGWMRVTRRARVFGTAGDLTRQEMLWISPRAADALQQKN